MLPGIAADMAREHSRSLIRTTLGLLRETGERMFLP